MGIGKKAASIAFFSPGSAWAVKTTSSTPDFETLFYRIK
jgi:hypothetical protein